jgi:hypothetical protein
MAQKFQSLVSGRETMIEGAASSSGTADGGRIVALGTDGKLDVTLMPTGIGILTFTMTAQEALQAGAFVNIVNVSGSPQARLADASIDRPAHGFVKTAFSTGASATVYLRSGINEALSGMTPGARQYLGAAGHRTETAPASPDAVIHQLVGIAKDATTLIVDIEDDIVLA